MTKQLRGTSEQGGTDTADAEAPQADSQRTLAAVEGGGRRGKPVVKLASQLQAAAVADASDEASCARCHELEEQVKDLRELRDRTLEELARAREQVNALRLYRESVIAPPPPPQAPPPLRYVIVDRINVQLKRYLGPVHLNTKRVLGFAKRSGGRREG